MYVVRDSAKRILRWMDVHSGTASFVLGYNSPFTVHGAFIGNFGIKFGVQHLKSETHYSISTHNSKLKY